MIIDTNFKDYITTEIKKLIPEDNLLAIMLTGSSFFIFDNLIDGEDIDILIVVKHTNSRRLSNCRLEYNNKFIDAFLTTIEELRVVSDINNTKAIKKAVYIYEFLSLLFKNDTIIYSTDEFNIGIEDLFTVDNIELIKNKIKNNISPIYYSSNSGVSYIINDKKKYLPKDGYYIYLLMEILKRGRIEITPDMRLLAEKIYRNEADDEQIFSSIREYFNIDDIVVNVVEYTSEYLEALSSQQLKDEISHYIYLLKGDLSDSDYKIIKCYESTLLGLDMPYNVSELIDERNMIRNQINEFEKLL